MRLNVTVNARFHAPGAAGSGARVALPDDEAQHLLRVLRLKAGDAIRVFDGRGHEFHAVVDQASKSGVQIVLGDRVEPAREARIAVTLAHAVLKGNKMDDVVRDAVMMGVAVIQPVITARTEVSPASLERGNRRERWQRVAVSSAKQCGRAVVPEVLAPSAFGDLPGALASMRLPSPAVMLVEPGAAADVTPLGEWESAAPREATVVVGPEGGWTPEELRTGGGAFRLVSLGGRTLRADAMAVVAVTALFTKWKEF